MTLPSCQNLLQSCKVLIYSMAVASMGILDKLPVPPSSLMRAMHCDAAIFCKNMCGGNGYLNDGILQAVAMWRPVNSQTIC